MSVLRSDFLSWPSLSVCSFVRPSLPLARQWHLEVERANAAGKPVILVGTKSDLRNDPDALQRLEARHLAPTSYDQGLRLARELGAAAYVECASTNSPHGLADLNDVLETLTSGNSKAKRRKSKTLATNASSSSSSSKAESTCCTLV